MRHADVDIKQIEGAADGVIDHIFERIRLGVEGRNGRRDDRPISESAVMLRRWPVWSGVSRTSKTSFRRSFRVTSAARVNNVVVTPDEISDIERTEQGATIIPIVRNEPLEIEAAISSMACVVCASALTSAILSVVS